MPRGLLVPWRLSAECLSRQHLQPAQRHQPGPVCLPPRLHVPLWPRLRMCSVSPQRGLPQRRRQPLPHLLPDPLPRCSVAGQLHLHPRLLLHGPRRGLSDLPSQLVLRRRSGCPPLHALHLMRPGQTQWKACACNSGYYTTNATSYGSPACLICGPGTCCNGGSSMPIGCTPNALSQQGAGVVAQCYCNAGYYGNYSLCMSCAAGTYTTQPNASACLACAPGLYSSTPAASSSASCILCAAGMLSTVLAATSCLACTAGTYSTPLGATAPCSSCLGGAYSTAGGASSSAACSLCQTGTYSTAVALTNSLYCLNCPYGKYSTASGAPSNATCTTCPPGTYTQMPGANSITQCTLCPSGSYIGQMDISCLSCALGTYGTALGASSSACCIACAPGTFQPSPFQTLCTAARQALLQRPAAAPPPPPVWRVRLVSTPFLQQAPIAPSVQRAHGARPWPLHRSASPV